MSINFSAAADTVLDAAVTSTPRVPGVVAMVTNRHRNIYEGAAGKRRLDQAGDMTTDSICVIFSTTKAITGRPCRSSSRKASLISTQPASRYAPEIGKLRVIDGFDVKGELILPSTEARYHHAHADRYSHGRPELRFRPTIPIIGWRRGQPSVITASRACLMTARGEPAPRVSTKRVLGRIIERDVAACMAANLVKGRICYRCRRE